MPASPSSFSMISESLCSKKHALLRAVVSLTAACRQSTTSCEAPLLRTDSAWRTTMPLKTESSSLPAPARISISLPGAKCGAFESGKSPVEAAPS
jgi:hypothetical protein